MDEEINPQLVEIINLPDIPQPIDYTTQLAEITSQIVTIGNVLIGLIIGYIAARGFFQPWNTFD